MFPLIRPGKHHAHLDIFFPADNKQTTLSHTHFELLSDISQNQLALVPGQIWEFPSDGSVFPTSSEKLWLALIYPEDEGYWTVPISSQASEYHCCEYPDCAPGTRTWVAQCWNPVFVPATIIRQGIGVMLYLKTELQEIQKLLPKPSCADVAAARSTLHTIDECTKQECNYWNKVHAELNR